MSKQDKGIALLNSIKGKTIALVYIFENEDAPGFKHYWIWKSDIIAGWLRAIQEIGCVPFVMDVRTFIQKAIYHNLPKIDFVINLNCGSVELSSMSLVPAMCSFISIPCIPCDAATIVMSENKAISNMIARCSDLNVPKDMDQSIDGGIFRPLNLGSSIGVNIGRPDRNAGRGTYQEFIQGYDATIPIVYNPITKRIDLLPPIAYIPICKDPNWIYDADEKVKDNGFTTRTISHIDSRAKERVLAFAQNFPITTFGRVDVRLKTTQILSDGSNVEGLFTPENMYFIEMNSMPTIEPEDSFEFALRAVRENPEQSLFEFVNMYYSTIPSPTINGYLLASSILSTTAMC